MVRLDIFRQKEGIYLHACYRHRVVEVIAWRIELRYRIMFKRDLACWKRQFRFFDRPLLDNVADQMCLL